ncbi:hypothetical protein SDC9_26022 [bioreactor metagenome]|uniref:Uncharacterized protein n=1 Tax=bioreactor metagenome TaxID=1076179 RepID=A0A644UMK8_9ZZZZ
MQDEILHLLTVMGRLLFLGRNTLGGARGGRRPPRRGQGLGLVIEVTTAQLGGLDADHMREMLHRALDAQHPLRPAEAAIGGVRLGVGAQPVAFDPQRRDEIGVVGMQHCPVADRQAEVGRPAAAGQLDEFGPQKPALGIGADPVVDAEIVALAGDDHVIVAVVAHLACPPGQPRRHRAGNGKVIALALLAAEAAAHAPHLDPHVVHVQAERLGHLVLHLGRVLRGTADGDAHVLGQGERGLAFQVEMLLTADLDRAFDEMGGLGQRRFDLAARPHHRPALEPAVRRKRRVERQDRRAGGIADAVLARRDAGGAVAFGDDEEHRLADVMHLALGQNGFGQRRGRGVIGEGHVGCGQHRDHARALPHGGEIHLLDRGARLGRETEGQMQCVRRAGDVIDIARAAGDVQLGRVMGQGGADAHACTSSTETGSPERSRR